MAIKIKNFELAEARLERRLKAREKKKKPKMRVSGAGVKQLQKIISGK